MLAKKLLNANMSYCVIKKPKIERVSRFSLSFTSSVADQLWSSKMKQFLRLTLFKQIPALSVGGKYQPYE